ncbi:hypothetical protein ACLOAU_03370 [Niabella sp. CJ426]|uniref:hypothetical protein n=1 Tax=Niabella sp. CJ426 TaxID=3393740 RepID=UPI003D074A41
MKVACNKCLSKEEIEIPDFTKAEKNRLLKLIAQSALLSIKYITGNYGISYRDAKFMVTHINKIYDHCNCCNFEKLEGEYIACPKCGALNFNWKRT